MTSLISRSEQIGEMREVKEVDYINRVWEDTPEAQQFHNPIPPPEDKKNHLEDVKVDPDKQLEDFIRKKFWRFVRNTGMSSHPGQDAIMRPGAM